MSDRPIGTGHSASHRLGISSWGPPGWDLLRVGSTSRRWFLRAGLSGLAGLSAPSLLRLEAEAAGASASARAPRSVILFWLSGGPSHVGMWAPMPDAPSELPAPVGTIASRPPGYPTG